jgi:hypothetical protein
MLSAAGSVYAERIGQLSELFLQVGERRESVPTFSVIDVENKHA